MKHQLSKISALDTAKNQRHAELLRSRIAELNQQLAILDSKRELFAKLLDGVRELASKASPAASTRAQSLQRTTGTNSRPRVSRGYRRALHRPNGPAGRHRLKLGKE